MLKLPQYVFYIGIWMAYVHQEAFFFRNSIIFTFISSSLKDCDHLGAQINKLFLSCNFISQSILYYPSNYFFSNRNLTQDDNKQSYTQPCIFYKEKNNISIFYNPRLVQKERKVQEENNGQRMESLCPFSLLFTHLSCCRIQHGSSHCGSKNSLFHNNFHK